MLFDLDNTLGPWGLRRLDPAALALLGGLRRAGWGVGILSNGRSSRRARLEAQLNPLGVPLVLNARKPLRAGFCTLLARLGAPPGQAVMVGDQWLTDVVGAKRLGMSAVLVDPVDTRSESSGTRLRRRLERRVLARWLEAIPKEVG